MSDHRVSGSPLSVTPHHSWHVCRVSGSPPLRLQTHVCRVSGSPPLQLWTHLCRVSGSPSHTVDDICIGWVFHLLLWIPQWEMHSGIFLLTSWWDVVHPFLTYRMLIPYNLCLTCWWDVVHPFPMCRILPTIVGWHACRTWSILSLLSVIFMHVGCGSLFPYDGCDVFVGCGSYFPYLWLWHMFVGCGFSFPYVWLWAGCDILSLLIFSHRLTHVI